ncbi:CRISPR-associated helicase, Cas3 family [Desulforamulus reducens MI-1]|uniref:CRISPR-associated helicase, Cas3 family n=1 Tax=Desulforamulus reducens (strain ATCC BAA-1160 / DSM 100696 / MI-1) TaxID=349161 RepID=A4J1Y0_DESRM|nr:CRISPR-associated helicase/endonuclease Cas3 [Desulforamulus reducens]ABO49083.1 CRISPR-associated helicase, Cas3 family [Desulforamulus reducens MI-1]
MTEQLKSHPHLFLHQHIEQVNQATKAIRDWHTTDTITNDIKLLLGHLAKYHDLGKGTPAFQEYIENPEGYQGDPQEKAHSTLSLLLTLAIARQQSWEELHTLVIAAAVAGHHSRLPTIPEKKIGGVCCPQWDIDGFAGGEKASLLKRQLASIDFPALEQETKVEFGSYGLAQALQSDPAKSLREMKRFLITRIYGIFASLSLEEALRLRMKAQLLYSVLLEADKALLAVSSPEVYLNREVRHWQSRWVEDKIGKPPETSINQLRQRARQGVIAALEAKNTNLYSLTAPTGCGKTMLAATWALKLRERVTEGQAPPKIIIVLPFLSVIDQTAREYARLLSHSGQETDGRWLIQSHSLADRHYARGLEDEDGRFFIDTWRSEIIITTYDQFLMSLLDPRAKYQMRFHNLCDAMIIMDEVQALPCKLWQTLEKVFQALASEGNSRLLLMSATLPPFMKEALPLLPDYQGYFTLFNRYTLQLRLQESQTLDNFCEEMSDRLIGWLECSNRILITLNTRHSARRVRDFLSQSWPAEYGDVPLFFISADVTPKDRLEIVKQIKQGKPCVVVSTQCIEAGVDIDMDRVIRDFGPLDSIIQIAGRCNREGLRAQGVVEVVDLINEQDKRYSEMIYDTTHLQITRKILADKQEIQEKEIITLSTQYFKDLTEQKDTGYNHLIRFAKWQEDTPVKELLRGKERLQIDFLVLEQDAELRDEMQIVGRIKDRWERREAWRKLSGRIALVSVSIFAQPGFHPEQIADEFMGSWWVVREGYYNSKQGLLIEGETMIL